ncbi:HD family phosphohydrolase [Undibacterium terreum]|uniref:HD family phosphohydrolase n=2 Tax=Undibacterium terreum TaxID=1224302 RepID=A0A916XD42_9BURK|nr:HD family phosphohydrolase [Undibacterium terreum]
MNNPDAEIIRKISNLPSLSAVVTELLTTIENEEVDFDIIAKKISHDQALTAKTLRLANSSFYGMQHKINSIQEAIAILGFRSVKTLITTTAITGSFAKPGNSQLNFNSFWRHSIATAVCAKQLATLVKANQDYAFTAGLLHDIGKLVLATQFSEQYEQVMQLRIERDCYIEEAESEIMSTDHSDVGRILTEHWKFPEDMQQAVANHHNQDQSAETMLTSIVHIADIIAHALDLSGDEEELVPVIGVSAWEKLNLTDETLTHVFKNTEKQFEEFCQILIG